MTERTRRRTPTAVCAALTVTVLLGGSAAAAPPTDPYPADDPPTSASTPADAAGTPPDGVPLPDEIRHSRNVRHVANMPPRPPFDAPLAFGTDIAFTGQHAIVGNYEGFTIYDISRPSAPRLVSQVHCPGSQNDVSVSGNLLFLSTDTSRSDDSCASAALPATEPNAWEGIKIFDIGDKAAPRYVASVETDCGSHTHTLVPDRRRDSVLLYVSSYGPDAGYPDCRPPHDRISIVRVPLRNPSKAAVVAEPVLFPLGGNPGRPGEFPDYVVPTSGCHDITVYPERDLAAAACMGDGLLLDISDRLRPRVIDQVRDDEHFSFWHSATFNQAATKVVFVDELGGGMAPACTPEIGPEHGASAVYDIVGRGSHRRLVKRAYFKIDRPQDPTENCVAHNGSLIPVPGRDILVQAYYQGGVVIWDFTDSRRPREIGYFERGPLPPDQIPAGGSWSAYYYNGHIYSSDLRKGLDVLAVDDPRTAPARWIRLPEFNAQTQPSH
ncbi:hypothetical protein GCM10022225_06610 [Plantactinospora mayteni]|uniref:LVIVD repeat-containing protein n=1 Tax=Plantactinospora mayteni TaxID=566021 RepID=A0ABQ4ER57_9ACTN|nr:hypothetical protein [Plantactinospora mayteni]GIG97150.1 hypothetical protein Pma05_37230 [Plantactinospora mayteni]